MIRKNNNGDINDEEFEKILKPFIEDYDNFVISYIMPEVIAYYIANSYYRCSIYEASFLEHYNSAKDLINLFGEDYEQVKAEVYKLLKSITKWYEFSFIKGYPKMTNFTNPNKLPEKQQCFTYEEFKQFLSVEKDLRWRYTYEILYYYGLRCGELRGLQ